MPRLSTRGLTNVLRSTGGCLFKGYFLIQIDLRVIQIQCRQQIARIIFEGGGKSLAKEKSKIGLVVPAKCAAAIKILNF